MNLIIYIFLGIIQGFTEPLPISSSGHLLVFRNLFNTNIFNDLNFEIIVNFGSFLAILFIFRKDIIELITSFFKYLTNTESKNSPKIKANFKYCLMIIVATIPAGIIGLIFKNPLEKALNNVKIVGIAFLITALSLFVVKNIKGKKEDKDISFKDSLIIGILQAFAIVPGLSRSGSTLVGCLLRDFKRDTAIKFSFILYFPISIASLLLSLIDIFKAGISTNLIISYLAGLIAATIVTYFSSKWFFDIVKRGKLWKFAIYCIIIGLFTLFIL